MDTQKLSIKNGDNIQELINKINIAINETKNELPINIVSELNLKPADLLNQSGSLSFILIGDSNVGKNDFLNIYFKEEEDDKIFLSTIGIDKEWKYIKILNDIYKLTIWDTAGQERFRCLPKKYYNIADVLLLFFDVSNEESFNSISNLIQDIKENLGNDTKAIKEDLDKSLFLIGNRVDKSERAISKEKAEEKARPLGMKYFEISSEINLNIKEVMARIIMECHMKINHIKNCFKLDQGNKREIKKKKGCYK